METSRSDLQLCRRLSAGVGLASACALSTSTSADVSMLDAGELGGAAVSLGVPHPSGFPLDMLLLHAASLWPIGPLAFRQNLCVGLLASAALSCIVYACLRLVRSAGWSSAPAAVAAVSVSAAVLLGSRTFLEASLSVEVYASSLLCVALAGVLVREPDAALRRALWPLAGLALAAHITAPLLIAPLACVALTGIVRRKRVLFLGLVTGVSCAALLSYVPLAALRDTAFDWGDPETLERWLRHVSAARIREAFHESLFTGDDLPRLQLAEQLTEQPYWLPLALMGAIGLVRQQYKSALALGVLLCLDLAYASWINPMGVAQRQVGHASVAVIALFAGVGCALLVELLPLQLKAAGRLGVAMIGAACVWSVARTLAVVHTEDGYAVSERYGAGSPLTELAPHALYVCESDSACASALFAVYAEGTRPDLDVVPAQHLWEPSVLRRLRGLPLAAASDAPQWPKVSERAAWASQRTRALLQREEARPVYIERVERLPLDLQPAPWIRLAVGAAGEDTIAGLERARFGAGGPESTLARELWASAHESLGAVWLARGSESQAVEAYARAVALTPYRAVARTNLGVALERRGDLHGALQQIAEAVEIDPRRPTPWVNLTRLLLRTQGPEAARSALQTAQRYELQDPRLDALTRELQLPVEASGGTTRK